MTLSKGDITTVSNGKCAELAAAIAQGHPNGSSTVWLVLVLVHAGALMLPPAVAVGAAVAAGASVQAEDGRTIVRSGRRSCNPPLRTAGRSLPAVGANLGPIRQNLFIITNYFGPDIHAHGMDWPT